MNTSLDPSPGNLMRVLEPEKLHELDVSPDVPVFVMSLDLKIRRWLLGVGQMFLENNVLLEGVRLEVKNWDSLSLSFGKSGDSQRHHVVWTGELYALATFARTSDGLRVYGFLRDSDYYDCEMVFQNPELRVEYWDRREFAPHTLP